MRLVNTAAATRTPSARRSSRACEEISIAQAPSPPSSISRNVRWRSIASGVVRTVGRSSPATTEVTVPSSPHCRPARLEQRADEEGGGGLAVRARHPHYGQRGRRVPVEAGGRGGHRGAHVLDLDLRHAGVDRPRHDQRGGAARHRVGREVVAVAREPGHAEEQGAGLHRAVVVGQAADLDRRPIAEQVSDGHPRAVYERPRRLRCARVPVVDGPDETPRPAGRRRRAGRPLRPRASATARSTRTCSSASRASRPSTPRRRSWPTCAGCGSPATRRSAAS